MLCGRIDYKGYMRKVASRNQFPNSWNYSLRPYTR
jgi:hypothetical protein